MPQIRRPSLVMPCFLISLSFFLVLKPAAAERFISPEQIEAYLKANNSPMVEGELAAPGIGLTFVIYGLAYNVDPRLIVGIANAESSLGKNLCNTFNAWGWFWGKDPSTNQPSCDFSPLSSWEAGVRGVTKDIRFKYLDKGIATIEDIEKTYCKEGCENWIKNVKAVYDSTEGLGGDPTSLTFSLNKQFFDGMDGTAEAWLANGFWHIRSHPEQVSVIDSIFPNLVTLHETFKSNSPLVTYVQGFLPPAYSATRAWWYGEDSTGTFIGADFVSVPQAPKSGGTSSRANSGDLVTPIIDLRGLSRAFLVFNTWWEIESVDADSFDILGEGIKVGVSAGGSFEEIGNLNPLMDVNGDPDIPYVSGWYGFEPFDPAKPGQPIWTPAGFDLSPYVGMQIRIRFHFDTRDQLYNGFRGWLIDDVAIFGIPQ